MSNHPRTTASRAARRPASAIAALVAVGLLAVSACGDDGDDAAAAAAATTPTTITAATTAAGGPTSTSPPGAAFDAATVKRLDELVRRFQDVNQTPGALIGIWSPQGTYISPTGVADVTTKAPLELDMQFKIASQTKSFTGNLALQLVSEGEVDLDDHISKWIDGVPNGDKITIRMLLNHTSGLADGFTDPSVQARTLDGCTVEELLTWEAKFPPVAKPGEKWSYSNYGFNLLGRMDRAGRWQGPLHRHVRAHHRPAGAHSDVAGDRGQRSHRPVRPRLRDRATSARRKLRRPPMTSPTSRCRACGPMAGWSRPSRTCTRG